MNLPKVDALSCQWAPHLAFSRAGEWGREGVAGWEHQTSRYPPRLGVPRRVPLLGMPFWKKERVFVFPEVLRRLNLD